MDSQIVRLFCLPYAGGSARSYDGFRAGLGDEIEMVPLELPGRGARFGEPLVTGLDELVADVVGQVAGRQGSRYALYGHSMGGRLAYWAAVSLRARGHPAPERLIVSGCPSPLLPTSESRRARHGLPRDELIGLLRRMGGCAPELLADDGAMRLFEPIIRADFQANFTAPGATPDVLDCPLTVVVGDEEETTLPEALAWREATRGACDVHVVAGNHFFILSRVDKMVRLLRAALGAGDRRTGGCDARFAQR